MAEQVIPVEEVLLEIARPEMYRMNAFRIAELPVDALTRDVSRRQKVIEQARQTGLPVPDGYGRALPLAKPPDPDTLSEALQYLSDPERRLVNELFWFWPRQFGESRRDEALAALARGENDMVYRFWQRQQENPNDGGNALHNLAILSHAAALDLEQVALSRTLSNQERIARNLRWQEAFRCWKLLIENEAFWSRVTGRVRELDDPRLTTGMAQRLSMSLPQALLLINAQLAVHAAERNDVGECQRQVALMRGSGFDQHIIDEALRRAVDPVRDRIKALCKMTETQASADPAKADGVVIRFLDQSQSLLAILDNLLPAGNATRDSIHDEVAQRALTSLVMYGNKTEKWTVVIPLLNRILTVATTPTLRTRIEENRTSAQNNLTLALCWYCGKNTPDKNAAYEVKMYGDVTRTPFWEYGQSGTRLQWRSGSISVPRCSECKSFHDSSAKANGAIFGWGCLTSIVFGIVAGLATGVIIGGYGVLVGLGLLVVINVIMISIAVSDQKKRSKAGQQRGIHPVLDYQKFPGIQLMLAQGWQVGEKPTA